MVFTGMRNLLWAVRKPDPIDVTPSSAPPKLGTDVLSMSAESNSFDTVTTWIVVPASIAVSAYLVWKYRATLREIVLYVLNSFNPRRIVDAVIDIELNDVVSDRLPPVPRRTLLTANLPVLEHGQVERIWIDNTDVGSDGSINDC